MTELKDVALGKVPDPPPLFHGFMLDKTITLITAPSYTCKSLVSMHMAICLDACMPLFGRFAAREVLKPLMVLQDAATFDYTRQARKLLRGSGLNAGQVSLLETNLVLNEGVMVTDPKFFETLAELKNSIGFDVLFLDALWTLHTMNENDNSQMGFVIRQLKRVRDELGAAVVLTHHERKTQQGFVQTNANDRAAGAGVIARAIDFHILLSRKGQRVRVQTTKARGMDEDLAHFDIEEVDHPDGGALRLSSVKPENSRLESIRLFIEIPRKRSEIIEFVKTAFPDLKTTDRVAKAVDNDLKYLEQVGISARVKYGVWELRKEKAA